MSRPSQGPEVWSHSSPESQDRMDRTWRSSSLKKGTKCMAQSEEPALRTWREFSICSGPVIVVCPKCISLLALPYGSAICISFYAASGFADNKHAHKLHLHYGDVTDLGSLCGLISKIAPKEIYNLAAQSHVQVSFELPSYTADAAGQVRRQNTPGFNLC